MTLATPAQGAATILARLDRCRRIIPARAGDEDVLCGSCSVPLVRTSAGYQHDPAAIRTLRTMALDGRWPR